MVSVVNTSKQFSGDTSPFKRLAAPKPEGEGG
jgi:hypothetical protein